MGAGKLRQGCRSGRESTARPQDIFAVWGGTWVGWVGPQDVNTGKGCRTPPHPMHTSPGPGNPPPSLQRRTCWTGSWTPAGAGGGRAPRGVGSQTSGHANSLHRSSFPQSPEVGAGRPAVGVGGLPGEAQDSQQATGCQPSRGPSCARRGRLPRWTLLRLARGPVDPGWTVPQRGHSRGVPVHADGAEAPGRAGHAVGGHYHVDLLSKAVFTKRPQINHRSFHSKKPDNKQIKPERMAPMCQEPETAHTPRVPCVRGSAQLPGQGWGLHPQGPALPRAGFKVSTNTGQDGVGPAA